MSDTTSRFYDRRFPSATLASPLEEMLADGEPDIPFALHWANTNWERTWMGEGGKQESKARELLVEQVGGRQCRSLWSITPSRDTLD